ncbi:deoxyribonuclease [Thermococcus sp. EP1]|uniref:YchF/TatD family DNA exonuclease n=1 Tax=Thermococcus sp. EP1 TaxID=1591054 RepID=UPI0006DA37B8|nr:YchF/TatD family DNA exonuclease [Thermococcus sp. EP1]KPU62595.1 deoxyribonuclease [Thermococcus sp. EP1]
MIDAHAHVEMFKRDVSPIIMESKEELKAIVDSITEYRKFHVWKSWELLKPYFGFIFPTLGFAPNEARRGNWEKVKKVEDFIWQHKDEIVAVGEIGLDYYYAQTEKERENQRAIFDYFLGVAEELKLPVVIHARDAERIAFEMVQRRGLKAYFHSYSGNIDVAKEIVENGHFIGINTGIVFIPEIENVTRALEIESILVETDAPYMSPFKGEKNKPQYIKVAIKRISEIKEISFDEVEQITERNTLEFFRLNLG